jgi:hypothetical protein
LGRKSVSNLNTEDESRPSWLRFRLVSHKGSCAVSGLMAILSVLWRGGRGCSSVGRAARSQCVGQGFESPQLHHPPGRPGRIARAAGTTGWAQHLCQDCTIQISGASSPSRSASWCVSDRPCCSGSSWSIFPGLQAIGRGNGKLTGRPVFPSGRDCRRLTTGAHP